MPILGVVASSLFKDTGPVGAYDALASVTVPAGGAVSVVFAGIPSGYRHLQIRMFTRYTGTQNSGAPLYMQFNNDTTNNYSLHRLLTYTNNSETGTSSAALTNQPYMQVAYTTGGSSTANMFSSQICDILDYANTNTFKTIKSLYGYDINNDSGYSSVGIMSGNWRSTTAVTSIRIVPDTDSLAQYSSFALYGVR